MRLGQLAADEEFAGTEYGSLFVNGTCGWPALIAVNVPSPAYPTATLGARLEWSVTDRWTVRGGVFDGDPYPVDAAGEPMDPHGTRFGWRDALGLVEVEYAWSREDEAKGLPGRAAMGGWYHTATYEHQQMDENGLCLAHPASSGHALTLDGNMGGYVIVEQQLWAEEDRAQGPGLFVRLGGAPPDRNPLELYLEAGLVWIGMIPGRDEDSFGVAVVHAEMSRDARELVRSAGIYTGSMSPLPDFERVVEATYTAVVRPGLTLQPVVGWVQHPGGAPGRDALVVGLRANVEL